MKKVTENINWTLLTAIGALTIIGLFNLYSALNVWGEAGVLRLVWLQFLWTAIGIVFMTAMAFSDYRIFERLAYALYIISLLLMAASLFTDHTVYGHKSWLGIAGLGIQPSEFGKVTTIIILSKYFSENPNPDGFSFTDLIRPAIIAVIPTSIVIMQHDLGSAMFFLLIFVSFAWFAKIKRVVIITACIASVAASVFTYYYVLSDYQKARITTFVNPAYDVKGSGYHMMQSRIAVGSGRIFGKGYLKGNINKLRYLPEKHTDFIFPVLAEEWGFAGSIVTLAIYYALLSMTIELGRRARDRLGTFLAIGVGSYLFWQITINLGGVLGLMPLTGVTLPFLSYGGSSTISLFILLGILLSVSRKRFVF